MVSMRLYKRVRVSLVALLLSILVPINVAVAELRIEVTKGVDDAVRVAVVPFSHKNRGRLPLDITEVIDFDLTLSGRFETLPTSQMLSLPNDSTEVFSRDWRLVKVEYLVLGYLESRGDKVQLHFELYNVFKQSVEVKQVIEGSRDELRDMAHYVSDVVFEQLTGIQGAFSTQIMYVTASGDVNVQEYRLNIADADGQRVRTILASNEPILSASWAPDGKKVAYVSFERDRRPAIYIKNLVTGARQQITDYPGLNSAPAFSPDGKQLAMVLSKDGSPDIYVLDLASRKLRRITRHYGIDTEPAWTPDGKSIVFTSDRGGKPQIYSMPLVNLKIERLTFEGDYNAKASMLADGSGLIMVHRSEGVFHIAMLDLNRGRLRVLTETSLDESPSIAPNGSMLIYATQKRGEGILAAVSIDGGVKFDLPSSEGNVREPAWSPMKRKVFTAVEG